MLLTKFFKLRNFCKTCAEKWITCLEILKEETEKSSHFDSLNSAHITKQFNIVNPCYPNFYTMNGFLTTWSAFVFSHLVPEKISSFRQTVVIGIWYLTSIFIDMTVSFPFSFPLHILPNCCKCLIFFKKNSMCPKFSFKLFHTCGTFRESFYSSRNCHRLFTIHFEFSSTFCWGLSH